MTAVPDYVPMLVKGASKSPEEGGCLVQIANWLADPTSWTDADLCVDHLLAQNATAINDIVDDEHRHQLAVLAPRLAGTKGLATREQMLFLYGWLTKNVTPILVTSESKWSWHDNGMVLDITTKIGLRGTDQQAVDWLVALLDEFERLTSHQPAELTEARWREVKELVGQ